MSIFRFLLLIGVFSLTLYSSAQSKISEEQQPIEEQKFVEAFFKSQNATESERINTQCELSFLFYQYWKKDKEIGEIGGDLYNAYSSILNTYRKTGKLDTSHRLYDILEEEPYSQEYYFKKFEKTKRARELQMGLDKPYNQGKPNKPIGDNDNNEKASTCTNSDFESGDLSGWQLSWGTNPGGGTSANINFSNGPNIGGMNTTAGYHTLMGPGSGMDPRTNGNVAQVYPGGGQYSMRLGDYNTGGRGAKASYTFTVTPQTELFLYHYAVILENPSHSVTQQPFLEINLTIGNQNDPCGYYHQAASASAPGFYDGSGNAKYKPWTTVSISLTAFMGQTVNIEFVAAGCSPTAHYGYSYIDAECMSMPTLDPKVINCFTPTPTVEGPPGATSYQWVGPGIIGANNTQDIQVNQPGTYTVTVVPVSGINCAYTVSTTVTEHLGAISASFTATPQQLCLGGTVNFQSTFTPSGDAGAIDVITWFFDDGNISNEANPNHTYADPEIYTVELAVITENGCTDTVQQNITVSPMPVADFSIDSVCMGVNPDLVNLSSVWADNGDAINSWDWNFGDGNNSAAQNPNHSYASENTYSITLKVETNNGCRDSITKTTLIYPNPIANFFFTDICDGETTTFADFSTVSNSFTPNNIITWDWDFDDGGVSSQQHTQHTYANEGVYNVTLSVETDNGCIDSHTNPVAVYPNPVADFLPIDVCLNAATTYTDASTVSNASTNNSIISWNWDFADGGTSNFQNPTHLYASEGIFNVVLEVETNHGCKGVSVIPVLVYPNPFANFIIDSVCQGTASSFVDLTVINTDNNNLISSWDWDFGDGQVGNVQNPIHFYNDENLYNVTLVVTSNKGCVDQITKTTAIYPNPSVDFKADDVCINFTTEFTDLSLVSNSNTSNQIVSWIWDFNDGTQSTDINPDHDYSSPGTYDVNLMITTNRNCHAVITKPVNVYPEPVAGFIGVDLLGCSPVCPVITSTSTVDAPSTITEYRWIFGNGESYIRDNPVFTNCFHNKSGAPVSYDVILKVTTDHGCVDYDTIPNYMTINNNPIASFHYLPIEPDIVNSEVRFLNNSKYAVEYSWDIEQIGVTDEENPTILFPEIPESYGVQLVAYTPEGCTDTLRSVVKINDKVLFFIPNTFTPDKDEYNELFKPVFVSGYDPQTYTLEIYNRWGEILFESHDVDKGWDGTYGEYSNKIVKDGTYIWKITFRETMSDKFHTYTGYINLLR